MNTLMVRVFGIQRGWRVVQVLCNAIGHDTTSRNWQATLEGTVATETMCRRCRRKDLFVRVGIGEGTAVCDVRP